MLVYRILEQLVLFVGSVWLMRHSAVAAVFLMGLFRARSGWLTHEGGHTSLTGCTAVDRLIQAFYMGFGLLTSGARWNKMHNRHHAAPQKCNHDTDLDTSPFVSFNEQLSVSGSSWWIRFQMYTFLPFTSGIIVPLFWILYLHPRKVFRDRDLCQMCFMVAGHVVPVCLFCIYGDLSMSASIGLQCTTLWLSHMYLFGHFALSHTYTDIINSTENPSWVRYANDHSVDIAVGNPIVDWIMGYLNYQVIHHLFPSMPQHRGPEVSKRWVTFCEKHALEYTRIGYFDAWYRMFANLNQVGLQQMN